MEDEIVTFKSLVNLTVYQLFRHFGYLQTASQYPGSIVQGDHSACDEPPVDFKTKVPLWPGQNGTFVLKSTGGFAQCKVSPCTNSANNEHSL